MKWEKMGLVFSPAEHVDWLVSHALQPTPIVVDNCIRIFFGGRDKKGVSRIGYVDLDKKDPTKILSVSNKPVLDIGQKGAFDDNGVVPSAIVSKDDLLYLFYAGYQIAQNVRFLVFGGLALSNDGGHTFKRYKRTPVFERTDQELLFRVPHSVFYENKTWKAWYGGGDTFIEGANKTLPVYDIRYTESDNPYNFKSSGDPLLTISGEEYRIGRPQIFKINSESLLFYCYGSERETYKIGYAKLINKQWKRCDNDIGLHPSKVTDDWDYEMIAYPAPICIEDTVYLFYNGNEYGKMGFGCAKLLEY